MYRSLLVLKAEHQIEVFAVSKLFPNLSSLKICFFLPFAFESSEVLPVLAKYCQVLPKYFHAKKCYQFLPSSTQSTQVLSSKFYCIFGVAVVILTVLSSTASTSKSCIILPSPTYYCYHVLTLPNFFKLPWYFQILISTAQFSII